MSRRFAMLAARLFAAATLLALTAWLVGLRALLDQLRRVDLLWFGLAVAAMAASQWVSVARWISIATILGLKAPARELRLAYAQAMAVNVVLPGATLGGDTLRSVRLQRLGNPLGESALSVLLDRASGLWILCLLSLCTGLGLLFSGQLRHVRLPAAMTGLDSASVAWLYLGALSAAVALPFVPVRLPGAATSPSSGPGRVLARLAELHALTVSRGRALARSLWSSLLVQALCALALWLCQMAAGGPAGYLAVQAIAAPVFIAGVMPLSYGGFGARELVSLLVFPLVGVDAQTGVAASALYGLTAVLLGLAAAPLLALRR
ncbi:MAG TPA: lysylphosphatidylglycerol synthase transmembrane domain-containing protein [Burkholderiaceae bacterium]|nr:lysylphosphatidylglycerol synthase transmembrane domain-containing protein [Burkholderiaceae bacterium]